ncbi:MAG: hypothetical protein ACOZBH_03480 [Patescibacteria group bacterium]
MADFSDQIDSYYFSIVDKWLAEGRRKFGFCIISPVQANHIVNYLIEKQFEVRSYLQSQVTFFEIDDTPGKI